MKIGFYPGCSLEGSSREYAESVFAIGRAFGIEFVTVPDWNCCGATAAHNMNHDLSLALPARILAIAEREGMEEIAVPCAACYSRLAVTAHELTHDNDLRARVNEITGMPFEGKVRVLNILQVLEKYVIPGLGGKTLAPFDHAVACYYGCLLVRPHQVLNFDRPEEPQSMDVIMEKIGAKPVDWSFRTECCGAGFSVSRTDLVAKLSAKILGDAVARGAAAIVVACPMCHSNLDMRRPAINKAAGKKFDIPVLYVTQALGMALGLTPKELGLKRHLVPVRLPVRAAAAATAGQPAEQKEV